MQIVRLGQELYLYSLSKIFYPTPVLSAVEIVASSLYARQRKTHAYFKKTHNVYRIFTHVAIYKSIVLFKLH